MRRTKRRGVPRLELLEPRYVLDSTVVFNEVMYQPAADQPLEFIELYNQMGVDVDISSWRLGSAVDFKFSEGTVVPTGGYCGDCPRPVAFKAATGIDALGPYTGRLANGGETIELLDRNDRMMDQMTYRDVSPWPEAADGWGASLAKRDRNTTSSPAAHWVSSIQVGGTPGAANFADQLDGTSRRSSPDFGRLHVQLAMECRWARPRECVARTGPGQQLQPIRMRAFFTRAPLDWPMRSWNRFRASPRRRLRN